MDRSGVHYADYLHLDKILNAQDAESAKATGQPAHEEHLFIVIHQGEGPREGAAARGEGDDKSESKG